MKSTLAAVGLAGLFCLPCLLPLLGIVGGATLFAGIGGFLVGNVALLLISAGLVVLAGVSVVLLRARRKAVCVINPETQLRA